VVLQMLPQLLLARLLEQQQQLLLCHWHQSRRH
jgi:hypothetical protein